MKIGGTASVYYNGNSGTEYQLFDNAFERIHPNAFDGVLRSNPDVLALFNHDPNQILGRTSSQTLRLWSDPTGLQYEVVLPDTQLGRDTYKLIERGDIRGSSFGALIGYAAWSKDAGGRDIRTIHRVKNLIDVSPVAMPAYGSTTVALRSQEIDLLKREREISLRTQMFLERIKNLS